MVILFFARYCGPLGGGVEDVIKSLD
jgi:hypothetical protein